MKVRLDGFSRFADTVHLETLKRTPWQDVAGLLNIEGVQYYYVDHTTIGVRYSDLVDPRDVAAQALRVLAEAHHTSLADLSVTVNSRTIGDIEAICLADDVWERSLEAASPASVAVHNIEARGTGPAYWLRT